jgi:hypothetical protein
MEAHADEGLCHYDEHVYLCPLIMQYLASVKNLLYFCNFTSHT